MATHTHPHTHFALHAPKLGTVLFSLLVLLCIASVAVQDFVHVHPHFEGTGFLGFSALFSMLGCTLLLLTAKCLAHALKKPANVYAKK